jgi:D-alanyl-D-alanine carboxypeptidase (penicillin-binding protein 5/6)
LWRDSSVDGLKTGHTEEAGYCLAASAKRGSMRLISVVLGTRSENVRAQETQKLLNYGFRFFETHHLYKTNAIITDTKIWKGERDNLQLGVTQDLVITVPRGQYDQLNAVTNVTQPVVAPITAGTVLGEVEITLGDELIAKEQLVALSDVPKGNWWRQLVDTIMLLIFG